MTDPNKLKSFSSPSPENLNQGEAGRKKPGENQGDFPSGFPGKPRLGRLATVAGALAILGAAATAEAGKPKKVAPPPQPMRVENSTGRTEEAPLPSPLAAEVAKKNLPAEKAGEEKAGAAPAELKETPAGSFERLWEAIKAFPGDAKEVGIYLWETGSENKSTSIPVSLVALLALIETLSRALRVRKQRRVKTGGAVSDRISSGTRGLIRMASRLVGRGKQEEEPTIEDQIDGNVLFTAIAEAGESGAMALVRGGEELSGPLADLNEEERPLLLEVMQILTPEAWRLVNKGTELGIDFGNPAFIAEVQRLKVEIPNAVATKKALEEANVGQRTRVICAEPGKVILAGKDVVIPKIEIPLSIGVEGEEEQDVIIHVKDGATPQVVMVRSGDGTGEKGSISLTLTRDALAEGNPSAPIEIEILNVDPAFGTLATQGFQAGDSVGTLRTSATQVEQGNLEVDTLAMSSQQYRVVTSADQKPTEAGKFDVPTIVCNAVVVQAQKLAALDLKGGALGLTDFFDLNKGVGPNTEVYVQNGQITVVKRPSGEVLRGVTEEMKTNCEGWAFGGKFADRNAEIAMLSPEVQDALYEVPSEIFGGVTVNGKGEITGFKLHGEVPAGVRRLLPQLEESAQSSFLDALEALGPMDDQEALAVDIAVSINEVVVKKARPAPTRRSKAASETPVEKKSFGVGVTAIADCNFLMESGDIHPFVTTLEIQDASALAEEVPLESFSSLRTIRVGNRTTDLTTVAKDLDVKNLKDLREKGVFAVQADGVTIVIHLESREAVLGLLAPAQPAAPSSPVTAPQASSTAEAKPRTEAPAAEPIAGEAPVSKPVLGAESAEKSLPAISRLLKPLFSEFDKMIMDSQVRDLGDGLILSTGSDANIEVLSETSFKVNLVSVTRGDKPAGKCVIVFHNLDTDTPGTRTFTAALTWKDGRSHPGSVDISMPTNPTGEQYQAGIKDLLTKLFAEKPQEGAAI